MRSSRGELILPLVLAIRVLTIIQYSDGKLKVVFADELTRPSHDHVREFLFRKYEECSRVDSINVDASFPSEIAMLEKDIVKEEHRTEIYKKWTDEFKKLAYHLTV